jgi:ribosomal protein S18 acetylase RimI-like enzyme
MSDMNVSIQRASIRDVSEVGRLFNAYRKFYGEPADEDRALDFIRERIELDSAVSFSQYPVPLYFLVWADIAGRRRAVGFMHLIPSVNTLAMRPIWFLEDLYIEPELRRKGIATELLNYAEEFARSTGAERLTLATAHDNISAQGLYYKLGYIREDHFWYFHRLLG